MSNRKKRSSAVCYPNRLRLAVLAVAASLSCSARADNFQTENGANVRWSLGASIGSSWRVKDADPNLIALGNGGTAGIQNDNGNLNFGKGKPFSTVANVIGDIDISKDNLGVFVRAKAWYDYTLEKRGVPHGSHANAYVPGARLNDSDFDTLSKFSGAALLDAYVYGTFDLPGQRALTVRLGKQVVNWGESLFIPGVNQFGAFDITAAHRPGAQVKEILLPIPQVFASVSLSDTISLEAFYQFSNRKHVLDGCGTYWSAANLINCSKSDTLVGGGPFSDQQMYNGIAALGGANMRMSLAPEREPNKNGQFGVAGRFRATQLDTDFALYHARYNSRAPNLSAVLVPTTIPGSIWAQTIPGASRAMQAVLDYSAPKIQVSGVTASTVLGGWSVFGELSHTKDAPVQINGSDLLNGVIGGIGPAGFLAATPQGQYVPGYNVKSKTQAQVSTLQLLPRVLGAENLTLIGEAAIQKWSGIGDPATSTRYGRAFVFGSGPVAGVPCAALNPNASYCENEGYATPTAWGYRILAELSYPNVFGGINIKPRVFLSHDVNGTSADGIFSEGRRTIAPGVRFEYRNRYYADLSYAHIAKTKYDEMHDRSFFSFVAGINF